MAKKFEKGVVLSMMYNVLFGQTQERDLQELVDYLDVPYIKTAYDIEHPFNRERDFLWEQFPQYRGLNPAYIANETAYFERAIALGGARVSVMSYAEFYPERVVVAYTAVPYDQIKHDNYFIGVNIAYSKDMLVGGSMREWLDAQRNKIFRFESLYSGLGIVVLSALDRSWIEDWSGFVSPTVEVQIAFVRNLSIYHLEKAVKHVST